MEVDPPDPPAPGVLPYARPMPAGVKPATNTGPFWASFLIGAICSLILAAILDQYQPQLLGPNSWADAVEGTTFLLLIFAVGLTCLRGVFTHPLRARLALVVGFLPLVVLVVLLLKLILFPPPPIPGYHIRRPSAGA